MKSYIEFLKNPFPPCLVGEIGSPFSLHEKKSTLHAERFAAAQPSAEKLNTNLNGGGEEG